MYLSSFMQMARQREYWAPPRLARIVSSIARNIPRQMEIFRVLALPPFRSMNSIHPAFPFKYLSTRYLVRGYTARERATCFLHHYRFLQTKLNSPSVRTALEGDTPLLAMSAGGSNYVVTLGPPRKDAIWEGELLLRLTVDGLAVYTLQFAVVPGWVVRSRQENVLLIQRLQGVKGCSGEIFAATKALHEVAPPALLVAALLGIANAWDIRQLAGVCARSQYSHRAHLSDALVRTYDDFYVDLGASRISSDFFLSPIPLVEKPIDGIRNGHKSRTRKKRAFKQMIADDVCRWISAGVSQAELAGIAATQGRVQDSGEAA
ncbi:MAG TPA: DUF535 family protein [Acidobacteriaceae bacterium]|jgi:uncharacterized protein VirK/YbjX|nr:DUF535 family protein [Acidobacteriaceae bacterium]